jgi:hypothetical protein
MAANILRFTVLANLFQICDPEEENTYNSPIISLQIESTQVYRGPFKSCTHLVLNKRGSGILLYKCTGYIVSDVSVPSAEPIPLSEIVAIISRVKGV